MKHFGGEKMETEKLTVGKALKFARHDFLNELQLMLLYMDLEDTPNARRTLLEATERMRHISMLEKLHMPKTEVWLSTFEWNHTVFSKKIKCNIVAGNRVAEDYAVADYLEQLICAIEKVVDPLEEYIVHIDVVATQDEWSIQLTIEGPLSEIPLKSQTVEGFQVSKICKDEQWTFTLSGQ